MLWLHVMPRTFTVDQILLEELMELGPIVSGDPDEPNLTALLEPQRDVLNAFVGNPLPISEDQQVQIFEMELSQLRTS